MVDRVHGDAARADACPPSACVQLRRWQCSRDRGSDLPDRSHATERTFASTDGSLTRRIRLPGHHSAPSLRLSAPTALPKRSSISWTVVPEDVSQRQALPTRMSAWTAYALSTFSPRLQDALFLVRVRQQDIRAERSDRTRPKPPWRERPAVALKSISAACVVPAARVQLVTSRSCAVRRCPSWFRSAAYAWTRSGQLFIDQRGLEAQG